MFATKRFSCVLAIVAFVGAVAVSTARANIIQNGSFEETIPQATTLGGGEMSELGSFYYATGFASVSTANVTNWMSNSRAWYMADGDITTATGYAPDGDWIVRLSDGSGGRGVLAQSGLSLTAGTTYNFTFDLWAGTASAAVCVRATDQASNFTSDTTSGANAFMVVTDHVKQPINGTAETVCATFTPTVSASYALQFYTTSSGSNHMYLDNAILTVVPEPGTLALLATGLLGLLCYAWRKRK